MGVCAIFPRRCHAVHSNKASSPCISPAVVAVMASLKYRRRSKFLLELPRPGSCWPPFQIVVLKYKAYPEPHGGIFGDLPASTWRGGGPVALKGGSLSAGAAPLLEECRWLALVVTFSEVLGWFCLALGLGCEFCTTLPSHRHGKAETRMGFTPGSLPFGKLRECGTPNPDPEYSIPLKSTPQNGETPPSTAGACWQLVPPSR